MKKGFMRACMFVVAVILAMMTGPAWGVVMGGSVDDEDADPSAIPGVDEDASSDATSPGDSSSEEADEGSESSDEEIDTDDDDDDGDELEDEEAENPDDLRDSLEFLKNPVKLEDDEEGLVKGRFAPFRAEGLTAIPAQKGSLYLGIYKNFYTLGDGRWEWGLATMFPPLTAPFVLSTVYAASPEQMASRTYEDYVRPALYVLALPFPYFKRNIVSKGKNLWAFSFDMSLMGGYRLLYSYVTRKSEFHMSIGTTNVGPVPMAWHLGMGFTKELGGRYRLLGSFSLDHALLVNPAEYLKTFISSYVGVRVMDESMYADLGVGIVIFLDGSEESSVPDVQPHPMLVLSMGWK